MMKHLFSKLKDAREGTAAIEFALIVPVFFLLIFGILELALMAWFTTVLIEGGEAGTAYMRSERLNGRAFTDTGLRTAVCTSVTSAGLSCDTAKLKIAPYYAGVPTNGGYGVPSIIENMNDVRAGTGGQYILALGYNWGISLPTSKLLFRQGPNGSQLQARVYTVLRERVWDDGVGR